ncbi:MAG: exodeoxyribonuclease VII large subunit [Betaproteobacteria bacterium RBG_16_66_20]|nr:MAG: exodeoxyribonuclease VII large subunit [Betaproteobacteria bacterium RBG_16_66_20]
MELDFSPAGAPVLSVSQLVRSARDMLERRFPLQWIAGEISNLRPASSGHLYFTIKDEAAQVDCVMFKSRAATLDWEPAEGLRVEVRALVTLYEPRGRFQLNVETMRRAGLGPLYERFLKLKDKLGREGLFDPDIKRRIPEHPRQIGVVTSLAAAALRDVLTTLRRRNASIPVIVYPAPVQGEGAAAKLAQVLAAANARAECDVLLLVRGGGSIEDLWQFNEEVLARAIRASRIPVVVGVGHETDFTIADFAADERAPTPTAAAELVSPSLQALVSRLADFALRLARETGRKIEYAMQAVDALSRRLVHPAERLRTSRQHLAHLAARLAAATAQQFNEIRRRLDIVRAKLESLGHDAVLARGYSLTLNSRREILRDATAVALGERIVTTLAKGEIESEVKKRG